MTKILHLKMLTEKPFELQNTSEVVSNDKDHINIQQKNNGTYLGQFDEERSLTHKSNGEYPKLEKMELIEYKTPSQLWSTVKPGESTNVAICLA